MRDALLALLRDLPDETARAILRRDGRTDYPQNVELLRSLIRTTISVLADTPAFRELNDASEVAPLPDPSGLPDAQGDLCGAISTQIGKGPCVLRGEHIVHQDANDVAEPFECANCKDCGRVSTGYIPGRFGPLTGYCFKQCSAALREYQRDSAIMQANAFNVAAGTSITSGAPTPAEPPSLPASEAQIQTAACRFYGVDHVSEIIPELYLTFANGYRAASSAPGAVQQDGGEDELSRLYGRDHGPNGPPWCNKCERIRDELKRRSAAGSPGDA